jgi:O-antigen/teichoic acid export membrane protein
MLLTAIGWPFLLFMAVMTYPLMLVLYGSQWLPAVDAARVLCVAGALHVLGAFAAQVMIAIGRIDHLLKVQVSLLPVKLALVLTGAWFGLEMLAVALLAWAVVAMMVYGRMVMRALDFRLREFLSIATKSGFVAAVTIAPALAVVTVLGWQPDSPVAVLLISLGACGVAYIGAIWLIRHPLLEQIGAAVIWLKRSVPE